MTLSTDIELPDHALRHLTIRQWHEAETEDFLHALDNRHYLEAPDKRVLHLCQVVLYGDVPVALLTWTMSSRALAGRDQFIGWDMRTRGLRLGYVVQNNRFLLLPQKRPMNLASRVLKLSVDHLPGAWQERYGRRPLLAETFVDPESYRGTCYRASGWINLGKTAGFSRVSRDYYESNEHPKDLWVKPLSNDALERLRDPSRALPAEGRGRRLPGVLPVKVALASSLSDAMRAVPDPRARRGRQFPLNAILCATVLALACGARSVSDIFRFCQDLSSSQRQHLGFRQNPLARKVVPPPGQSCLRKVLARVDPDELARALNTWLQSHYGELPPLLSIDGKVIGNNLATLVSLVDATDGSPVAQHAAAGNGKEQALSRQLIEEMPEGALEGKTLSGDALYANKDLVREVVQQQAGHVLVQLKANQKTTLQQVQNRLEQEPPPF